MQELLDNHASTAIKNSSGMTPSDLASQEIASLLKNKQPEEDSLYRNRSTHRNMVERMLQSKADLSPVLAKDKKEKEKDKDKQNTQFWRKKGILKMYQFIR